MVSLLFVLSLGSDINDFRTKLQTANEKIDEILLTIENRWQLKMFPNFLKSAAMSTTSWDILKVLLYTYFV